MSDYRRETDQQIIEAARALRSLDPIRPQVWSTLSFKSRLEALQNVEDTLAAIQGRPSVRVQAVDLGPGVFGAFDEDQITVNLTHLLGEMPVEELVDTIVHEGRHAYQQYAVAHPGFVIDEVVVARWADNLEHYLDAEIYGQRRYMDQPIEADAWDYAERIRRSVYPGSL